MRKILESNYITLEKAKHFVYGSSVAKACWSTGNQKGH